MEFVAVRASAVRSIRQHWLLQYWDRLRNGRVLPSFERLDGNEIVRTAEILMFCEVVPEANAQRFRIRFQGKQITEAFGADCSGKFLDQTLPPAVRDATLTVYRQAVDGRNPVYTVADTFDRQGRPVCCERLLLPFGADGSSVDHIVASLDLVSIEGAFEQRDMMTSLRENPAYSLCATINVADAPPAGA